MDALTFILAALACFRLAELVAVDSGPLDVFLNIRIAAGTYDHGEDGRPKKQTGRLVGCPYCVGVWIAFFMAALLARGMDVILLGLALSGAQALLQGVAGREPD